MDDVCSRLGETTWMVRPRPPSAQSRKDLLEAARTIALAGGGEVVLDLRAAGGPAYGSLNELKLLLGGCAVVAVVSPWSAWDMACRGSLREFSVANDLRTAFRIALSGEAPVTPYVEPAAAA